MLFTRDDAGDSSNTFVFYRYLPSVAAAAIFTVLFGFTTVFHAYQLIRSRTWFMIPFLIGGIFETIGYIGRILSAQQNPGPYTLGPFILQTVLLLVAPALLAASIYMQLSRVVQLLDADQALFIRRTWLTKLFVTGDVLSFLLQAAGAGLLSSGDGANTNTGKAVIVVGLILQVIYFGLFVLAAAIFNVRVSRHPPPRCAVVPWWKKHMFVLYLVSVLIFIRSIVRTVEYIEGYTGYVMTHEAFLYVFDALVMFAAMVAMNVVHPGEVAKELRGGFRAGGAGGIELKNGARSHVRPWV
ncbi:hypothetical protein BAUCODRAFT_356584 [Baudoinia panamericana UAMH 10762]|uniref:RTA1 like protein n=1 Tax=Baudoinia panamericana (strain UAMH 10762) TaxID=717646 RepID=M2NKH4_BAUPA|nr:uncharacterized protein BAUCODRAFT_356584 [Baudoinia panamericana UAMH 10762]EMC99939.1 hypothetical protein BAUCODRAFT_356584 [Baudoinia panamericana UAMH 10762]